MDTTSKRQVTIIDELWDNEQSNANRRLYDEHERTLKRQNIELTERLKNFEALGKDQDKELIKRALARQAADYHRSLTRKDQEIEHLQSRIHQLSEAERELRRDGALGLALRQSNLEKLHLEKRLLSSSSSAATTTTHGGASDCSRTPDRREILMASSPTPRFTGFIRDVPPERRYLHQTVSQPTTTTTSTSTSTADPYSAPPSPVDPQRYQVLQKSNELLKSEVQRLASAVEEHTSKLNLKLEQYDQLHESYQRLLAVEDRYKAEQAAHGASRRENERLKAQLEDLRTELQQSIKDREATSVLNNQLRTEINNARNTSDRLADEGEQLRRALVAKAEEYEEMKTKNLVWERRAKNDEFEQYQRMHDTSKREHQETIRQLQAKIDDLERKTELQWVKHNEILQEFESLRNHRDRLLPSLIESEQSFTDDSAPIYPTGKSKPSPPQPFDEQSAQIVKAKYFYEPLKSSPNEHPEIELPLKRGEFYLVYGEPDEDGFYDGRNLEGRYGIIPSNFIEFVSNPQDLPDQARFAIQKLSGKTFPNDERVINRREDAQSIDSDVFTSTAPAVPRLVRTSSSSDLSSEDGKRVPAATHLRVEKSFSNSTALTWDPPVTDAQILGYQVLLDHALFTTIRANDPPRALLENLNTKEKNHRVSVRTITQRGLSHEQQCTLLVNATSFAPTDLRVDRIHQTSAVVSWWPASNDLAHRLLINDVELQTLQPGIYRFKLSGLLPNTVHKVTIAAKPSGVNNNQQLAASTEFSTTGFDESIEPPKLVQAIPGPQPNTLLVSWDPILTKVPLRGYRILIDGRQVQETASPLNDRTLVSLSPTRSGRLLTIRTVSERGGESSDSAPLELDPSAKKLRTAFAVSPRAALESPSTASSTSTDIPQIELKPLINNSRSKTRSIPSIPMKKVPSPSRTTGTPRLFVALYNYDPKAMSPNSDSEEELPFKEGQIIKIYGDQDADGFYMGQIENGRTGLVPSNMVSEVPAKPPPVAAPPMKKMVALYDYNPAANSPNTNSTDELSFKSGEVILVHGDIHDDGFYDGELENGRKGLVPSNYLREAPVVEKPAEAVPTETKAPVETVNKESNPVKSEPEPSVDKAAVVEEPKAGMFDRLKNTFSWNFNEPI